MAYSLLQQAYPAYPVNVKKEGFDKTVAWYGDKSSLYVCISRFFFPGEKDQSALFDFVEAGNTVFISASLMDSAFLAQVKCQLRDAEFLKMFAPNSWKNTAINILPRAVTEKESFRYFYLPFESSFKLTDNLVYNHKLSFNQNAEANCILLYLGKGKLFLHSEPRALSNYFLLTQNNHLYFKQLMQLLPAKPENLYWDDFYHRSSIAGSHNKNGFSLGALMASPPLKWAFLLSLLFLFLYILFNGKRRQRIVPVIPPVENSSIRFAQAIAGIYLNEKDNKAISEKMILYFNDQIRNHYFINLQQPDLALAEKLSRKSGVPIDKTREICDNIADINASTKVTDNQLLALNQSIQYFQKNKF